MDIEPSITQVAREAIEAALSAYHSEPDSPVGELSEEMRAFANIVAKSDELKAELIGLAAALLNDVPEWDFDLAEVQRLARSGELSALRLLRLATVCARFLFVGWHARGAVAEGDQLNHMSVLPGPSKQRTLYHRTSRERAEQIIKDGFRDGIGYYLTAELHKGVWFSDRPLDSNEGADGDALLVIDVEMTDDELWDFEWIEEGKPYREWLIPAEVINPRIRSLEYSDE
jgi:hypothetical protein